MITQDKGAVGTHVIEVDLRDLSQNQVNKMTETLADEIVRLRKENEALRSALVCMALRYSWQGATGHLNAGPYSGYDTAALEAAFKVLGWPNPCPKEKAV